MYLRLLALACTPLIASAALAERQWDRTYPLSGRPSLQLEADNASVEISSCGECRSVHIHLDTRDVDLSEFKLEESASGNQVRFHLQRRSEHSFFSAHHSGSPRITVELPAEGNSSISSGNGDVTATGLQGELRLHTGNGAAKAERSSGSLRLDTGNGEASVHDGSGRVTLSSGNGVVHADGRLTQVEAHTGNGKVDVSLAPGSRLNSTSHLDSGNGSVTLRVPRDLPANLQLSSGNGGVHCDLPVTSTGGSNDRFSLKGTLNGGGPLIDASSGSGAVSVGAS